MALTDEDNTLVSDCTSKGEHELLVESLGREGEGEGFEVKTDDVSAAPFGATAHPPQGHNVTSSSDTQTAATSTRPSLVQLGSVSPLTTSTHHPKKYNTVNINKKFLEKNSAGAVPSTASSNTGAVKLGTPIARPQVQSTSSHSRLVTTKLTAAANVSTSAAGWSRPSSAAPSSAATGSNSPIGTSPLPSSAIVAPAPAAAPQLPHAGKVIQPQPRAALVQTTQAEPIGKVSSKPVWGNLVPSAVPARLDIASNDFPTAAEVAKVITATRKPQSKPDPEEVKPLSDAAAANKQARMEEADTFRGVHLDPNAHHWDEMEEDDDNFLGGVIEFGDGRQYKVEAADDAPPTPPNASPAKPDPRQRRVAQHKDPGLTPVSKEERFVDDFDRSWPKSRTSPVSSVRDVNIPSVAHNRGPSPSSSPVISHQHSPQDSSRVLFNERSNRMEPYTRTGQSNYPSKRSSYQEHPSTSADPRSARESSFASQNNIQLLQKPGEIVPRPRGFSGGSAGGFGSGPHGFTGDKQRDSSRREGPPPSPRMPRDHFPSNPSVTARDREPNADRGRRSNMGPPVVPNHALTRPSQEGARQLPPHLTQVSPNIRPRRLSSRDSSQHGRAPASHPSHSPALSHASLSVASPAAIPQNTLPQLSAPELDEARSNVMQNAAARAKQRRQQEEEEREAQKERARRKAIELEEKMKAADVEKARQKEAQVATKIEVDEDRARIQDMAVSIIEEAVKSVEVKHNNADAQTHPHPEIPSAKHSQRRPPTLGVGTQIAVETGPITARRTSIVTARASSAATVAPSPAGTSESWRTKPTHGTPSVPAAHQGHPRTSVPTFLPPPLSALEQVETLADGPAEDLEVVDFSDMGTFVGSPTVAIKTGEQIELKGTPSVTRPARPVASDFFELSAEQNTPALQNVDTWRKTARDDRTAPQDRKASPEFTTTNAPSKEGPVEKDRHRRELGNDNSSVSSNLSSKEASSTDVNANSQVLITHSHAGLPQRTPRTQGFYKEAAMSALDDTMSRIKGALVGMHNGEASKELAPPEPEPVPQRSTVPIMSSNKTKDRWIPPALRSRNIDYPEDVLEVFHVTVNELPQSPKPAWNSFIVRLPTSSHSREPPSQKQIYLFSRVPFPARMDILSFIPPNQGWNRRDLTMNDHLFGKAPPIHKRVYRVVLPRSRGHMGPRVNIPSLAAPLKVNGVGAFGRPTVADGATSWRKATTSTQNSDPIPEAGLSTTSRSPPPDILPSGSSITSIPKPSESFPDKNDGNHTSTRPRSIPKMPAGFSVAFYRDSRVDIVEPDVKNLVNFIVTSELEDGAKSASQATESDTSQVQPSITITPPMGRKASEIENAVTHNVSSPSPGEKHTLLPTKLESKNLDESTDHVLTTPTQQHSSSSWARSSINLSLKESPARGPDPEHLKAVWSQTSNKAGLHAVNSLEGIADDLTALPFTLQDVKSEDGETPPPMPSAPSRMSLHDVTRAFQQVPSSSNSAPHRAPVSPPLTSAPVARPTYSYTPLPPGNIRPTYAYASPMMSHSPTPTLMYPHPIAPSPVPNRMQNGHTPLYSQPMWMTMGGPPQNPNMMRQMGSPYPAQIMSYASPSTPTMYPPTLPNMPPNHSQQGLQNGRGRGIPVMSPVMSHATANMYASSPVLIHTPPVMQVNQNHGYMPLGRGQPRVDGGQHPPPFNPVASSTFARQTW